MKIAVVSDIHANLQAWNAVWLDIRSMAAERVICLGDTVGYGPNPVEVLESLYTSVDYFVLGNHDAVICGKMDRSLFNESAQGLIEWTARQLGPRAIQVLNSWPLTLAGPGFRCAHGEFGNPGRYHYVLGPKESLPSWKAVPEPLLFIGHTHYPCLYVIGKSGIPHELPPQDFALETGKRYLVNVGSAGYSRDGDPRASYCLYDTTNKSVFWRRIPFDLDVYRAALERTGLPLASAALLEADPRRGRAPLRELVPFSPPDQPDRAVKNTVAVQYVESLRKGMRRWQRLFMTAVICLAIFAAGIGFIGWRHMHRDLDLVGTTMSAMSAREAALGNNMLIFPATDVTDGQPVPGWHIHLGNRYHQQASWGQLPEGCIGWKLHSGRQSELWITSPLVSVSPGMKFTMQGRVWKSADFKGSLALVIALMRQAGTDDVIDQFVVKEPTLVRADGWSTVKQTFFIPARAEAIHFQIRGRFQGTAYLHNLSLERKK